eukprot:GHVQ01019378.1.p2 GENE.GHVQ01019378.1~~GHVQ01019378.1.p2  ORF type:complete len:246 (-),score=20.83 GHVQ01019378.1:1753-2490(-)
MLVLHCTSIYSWAVRIGCIVMGGDVSKPCLYCVDDDACTVANNDLAYSRSHRTRDFCSFVNGSSAAAVGSLAEAEERLRWGLPVTLILKDRKKVEGRCRVDTRSGKILLTCNRKIRIISFSGVLRLLHTPIELEKIESRAGGQDHYHQNCVAVQLKKTHSCIPLFFDDLQDKLLFLHSVSSGIGIQVTPGRVISRQPPKLRPMSDATTQTMAQASSASAYQSASPEVTPATDGGCDIKDKISASE